MQKAQYKQYSRRQADNAKTIRADNGYKLIEAFIARALRINTRVGGAKDVS